MPLPALELVLLAAVLHAVWNYLAKSARNTVAFLWWALLFGTIGYGVYILATASVYLPREVWLLYLLSISAEVGYLVTLSRGYADGDLSLVYPLSRGSAPIFVTLWSAVLLGERLPVMGYFGIAIMVAGIYVASYQPGSRLTIFDLKNSATAWALLSGVFISLYSFLDKIILNTLTPLIYNFWVYVGMTVLWTPFVWFGGRRAVLRNFGELRQNLPRVLVGSVMTVGAYIAALVALTLTSASYVVAGRGTSVLIGALLGWLALGEGVGRVRVIGAALMVTGLAFIAFAK
jgi:drug/metabolite transporter (DMT)-like permease